MKDFKVFESAVIGLLIGVVVSAYILFVSTSGRFVGQILYWISLTPVIDLFPQQYKDSIVVNFLMYVCVFVLYTIIINLIFRMNIKVRIVFSILLIVILIGIGFEQKKAFASKVVSNEDSFSVEVAQLSSNQKVRKYFGEEVFGDLNSDSKDDVAFLIKRNDEDGRGDMYYVTTSLKTGEGYQGTNLLFVGEKIKPEMIEIIDGLIKISYINIIDEEDVEDEKNINFFYAKVIDGVLTEADAPEQDFATTTDPSLSE